MKILILYTARSGTNSIADYFLKQNPKYEYFNQPFALYYEKGIRKSTYIECLEFENVLFKSEISSFKRLGISKEQILKDFDKVMLISRKNKRKQAISYIIAGSYKNYLEKKQRNYYIEGLDEELIKDIEQYQIEQHELLEEYRDLAFPYFYYEDLYHGDFADLFEYLEIKYIGADFDEILDSKNRYRHKDLRSKAIKTLV
jgi:hypothetical protein